MNPENLAVQVANGVLRMKHELDMLREENAELRVYRDKYTELFQKDIKHNGHMMVGLLELVMKPGVMDAIGKANDAGKTTDG